MAFGSGLGTLQARGGTERTEVTRSARRGLDVGVTPLFGSPLQDPASQAVLGAALAVHSALGPGLLESVYQECMQLELLSRGIRFQREVRLPLAYAGRSLDSHLRLDLLVERQLVVEIKCVEKLLPIHRAQVLTYLRMGEFRRGLLLNFNVPRLRAGIMRIVL